MTSSEIDALIARDLAVLWHPCSQMRDYHAFPPLPIIGAEGVKLKLADGREIYDAISSWWCKSLGHNHPRLRAALTEQAAKFEHVILANTTNEPIVRFCERILTFANGAYPHPDFNLGMWANRRPNRPNHFGKVFFAGDGSVAVEIALKMAVQAQTQRGRPQRTRFAAFENGYHGETVATLSVGDCGLYGDPYRALMFPTTILRGLPYRSGPHDPMWNDASAEWPALEAQLDPLADQLAAVIYEPVLQAAGGMRVYSPDLLPRLRRWADAHGVYLIADEIAAGMGRCGAMLASQLCEERGAKSEERQDSTPAQNRKRSSLRAPRSSSFLPDFAVLSKGLTAGYLPMAVVLTTQAVYDLFDAEYHERRAFLHSNTYAGNALAVAVANAVLDVFENERVLDHVANNAALFDDLVHSLAVSRPYLKSPRSIGAMFAFDIRQPDGSPLDPLLRTGYRVYQDAVRRGALFRPLGDTMYLFPPLNSTRAEVTAMVQILSDSLDAVVPPLL